MTDIYDQKQRSLIMSRVKGKDTKPELYVRSLLHQMGYRFRLHSKKLPGKPDICLPKYRTVILIHGCYWHRHADCKKGKSIPSTNREFWEQKFKENIYRDKRILHLLEALGWKVLIIWECEINDTNSLKVRLESHLSSTNPKLFFLP